MKAVILALLVVLVVSQGEALRCYCGGQMSCPEGPIHNCYFSSNTCASVTFQKGPLPRYTKSCMKFEHCMALNIPGVSSAKCCMRDLCNK